MISRGICNKCWQTNADISGRVASETNADISEPTNADISDSCKSAPVKCVVDPCVNV